MYGHVYFRIVLAWIVIMSYSSNIFTSLLFEQINYEPEIIIKLFFFYNFILLIRILIGYF